MPVKYYDFMDQSSWQLNCAPKLRGLVLSLFAMIATATSCAADRPGIEGAEQRNSRLAYEKLDPSLEPSIKQIVFQYPCIDVGSHKFIDAKDNFVRLTYLKLARQFYTDCLTLGLSAVDSDSKPTISEAYIKIPRISSNCIEFAVERSQKYLSACRFFKDVAAHKAFEVYDVEVASDFAVDHWWWYRRSKSASDYNLVVSGFVNTYKNFWVIEGVATVEVRDEMAKIILNKILDRSSIADKTGKHDESDKD